MFDVALMPAAQSKRVRVGEALRLVLELPDPLPRRLDLLRVPRVDRDFDDVVDTAEQLHTGFPTLHDAGGATAELYQVNRMPYVVLIDQDGIVREEFTGFSKGEGSRYVDEARTLLAE